MAGKKGSDSSKKAAGQARKADAAASKAAAEQSKKDAVEDAEWSKGSKSSAKKCVLLYFTLLRSTYDAQILKSG